MTQHKYDSATFVSTGVQSSGREPGDTDVEPVGRTVKRETLIQKLIPTLFEDETLLAVDKPAGVDAGGGERHTAEGVAEILSALRGKGEKLLVANRLTRYESGVLLLGKDPRIVQHIRSGLRAGRVTREYLTVVHGRLKKPQLRIDPVHGSSRGRREQNRTDAGRRRRVDARKPAGRGPGKGDRPGEHETFVRLMKAGTHLALVRCRTTVPTTHALRAQIRSIGLRVMGDETHKPIAHRRSVSSTRLHLARIEFHNPRIKKRTTITCRPPAGFRVVLDGGVDLERPLRAALVKRLSLFSEPDTNCFRLLSGISEDLKGVVAEKYDDVVVLQIREEEAPATRAIREVARWYRETLGCRAVYVKHFPKSPAGAGESKPAGDRPSERAAGEPLVGEPVSERMEIVEHGIKFAIAPGEGGSVGLFLDHRDNRARVRSLADGKRVLNLFAYTCGFSVAAAAGGAAGTTSVDISRKNLQWGRDNFALNGIDLGPHEFFASDAIGFLKRALRQERRYDVIIIDPPTFAHGRRGGGTFSIVKDLPELISGAVAVLEPSGVMMISTNHRRLSIREIQDRLKAGAGGRTFTVFKTPRLPIDFAADPNHAKTLFVRFA